LFFAFLWWWANASSFEEITGIIDPTIHREYVLIPSKHTKSPTPIYIKAETYKAFLDMSNAAKKDGVNLLITSWRRSFAEQEILFAYYGFDRALPPGTSSHHFWNAIDFANNPWGGWAFAWLTKHAHKYWFCQTYDGHSSGQWEELRHYEYKPDIFRRYLIWFRDDIYAYLEQHNPWVLSWMSKEELFATYVYPISHACIDAYPSRIDDPITGIRFDRKLDSNEPDHLVYRLSPHTLWTITEILPTEVRFQKHDDILLFASSHYTPKKIQDFFNYTKRFRKWVENIVLLRVYTKIHKIGG
jgi:hypothetical protein